ncbi:hypothetical protein [Nitrospirillum pindoramense]|uniref:Uncharacterized protein n=1 Tax=Nitrospirillum amazonense TaxID=28077 RepID=A0A560GK29_9PROT|nr:hypothetical protein [Nitrospirillum amazonense]TWB34337.1 hypothetical protein FBZ90_12637 [Nitrospirillum amazonense]
MENVYDVTLSTGESYTVTTEKHHDDHTDEGFKRHLREAIKTVAANVIGGIIIHEYHLRRPAKR